MKNVFFKIFTSLSLIIYFTLNSNAQTHTHGFDCLGVLCRITVNLEKDPVTSDGYLRYTIITPPEGAYNIQGPAGAFLANNLGSTVDIYIRKSQLELAVADRDQCEIPFELLVYMWKDEWGNPASYGIQCYYHVILMVDNNIL